VTGIRHKAIGITVYVYRVKKGISKAELGRAIGYSRSAILLIEKGKRGISPLMIPVFAHVLEIDPVLLEILKNE
jgi:transcriptional regulator with XRE-family HTH domain